MAAAKLRLGANFASVHDTAADPFTLFPEPPMVIVRAVPQLAVVMLAEPLNDVPLIVRAVVSVAALPVMLPLSGSRSPCRPRLRWARRRSA